MSNGQMNKTVSVIIPNYNKEKYLRDCVDSVLSQSYPNIEIMIVDDCSTDRSRDIIHELQRKNNCVKAILLSDNAGVRNARNVGAKAATGYYLTFLDSDDIYINNKKNENELNLIKNDTEIAFSQWVKLDVNGSVVSDQIISRNIYRNRYAICKILSISRPPYQHLRGYLITKRLFDTVGGYTFAYDFFEDFDFQCRLVLNGKLRYTGDYGEGYRDVPGGLSKNKILNANRMIDAIQNAHYQKLAWDQKLYYKFLKKKKSWLFKGRRRLRAAVGR